MEVLKSLKFTRDYWEIILPLILMIVDVITGYYNAWKTNSISSSRMRDGIGKKLAEIAYIVTGMLLTTAFNLKTISYFISLYITYMELISVLENCQKLGVEMPDKLKEKLNNKGGASK